MAARAAEDADNEARWRMWQDLEREALERAEWEADLARQLARDMGGSVPERPRESQPAEEAHPKKSKLTERLEAAIEGQRGGLARRTVNLD